MHVCRVMSAIDLTSAGLQPDYFAFRPDAHRGRLVDGRVRAGFADSIAAVLNALAPQIDVSGGESLVARIRAEPVSPAVFGVYTELVEAIHNDDLSAVDSLAGQLCAPGFGFAPDLRVVTLTDDDLGVGQADRYRRFIDEDADLGGSLPPLRGASFSDGEARIRGALALLETAAPEVAGEVRSLAREIVLVGHPTDEGTAFDGASSFHLWGALFLNTDSYVSRVEIAEALAHESTHALLFGFAGGRTLVDNDPDARYSSPLRSDPRPMDGIVHATYVLARLHYTVSRLLESNLLTEAERRFAVEAKKRSAGRYAEGIGVVDKHAIWTPPGEAAIAGARAYMNEPTRG